MNTNLRRGVLGFIAGFLATLAVHQFVLAALWWHGVAPLPPFRLEGTPPLGVPAVLSLAFWGGVWGVILERLAPRFPGGERYWGAAFGFGAVAPTLVALLIVVPLKGGPVGAGGQPAVWFTAAIVNAAWGLATAAFLRIAGR